MSQRLVTIMTDLRVDLDLEGLALGDPNAAELRDLFLELEFRRLAEQFGEAAQAETPSPWPASREDESRLRGDHGRPEAA